MAHDVVHDHHAHAPANVTAYVITSTDTRNASTDSGGALAIKLLEDHGHTVVGQHIVKDEILEIQNEVRQALTRGARLVVITGGTGFSQRDVSVEAVGAMFSKIIDGFGELFRQLSFQQIGPAAMLSRSTGGIVTDEKTGQRAAVFVIPGSPKAVKLALESLILPEAGHLVHELSK